MNHIFAGTSYPFSVIGLIKFCIRYILGLSGSMVNVDHGDFLVFSTNDHLVFYSKNHVLFFNPSKSFVETFDFKKVCSRANSRT